jgi:AbrB family looped-hinge helix DNA binding protein
MAVTVLSSKGQLIIPIDIRKSMGLKAGDEFACKIVDGRIILERAHHESATLSVGEDGEPVLVAPEGSPEMTAETVKSILAEFPFSD